jgi:hypothetical protein
MVLFSQGITSRMEYRDPINFFLRKGHVANDPKSKLLKEDKTLKVRSSQIHRPTRDNGVH